MQNVELIIDGMKATLDNGIISISFNEKGSVSSLIKNGRELVCNLSGAIKDINKERTFYLDYHANGKFRDFNPDEIKVLKEEKNFIHIVYIDSTSLLYAEYHSIMKSGESGLYSYVIVKNNSEEKLEVGELRTVYRMGEKFNIAYNSERIGLQPAHPSLEENEWLQDETYKMKNGEIYSKYDYAGYFSNNPCWGQYGDGLGAWFIPVSNEYYPSGPLKQELLVHYNGIILNYMTGAHFGTGVYDVPKDWEKLYGPWLFYLNEGEADEMIEDAINKANYEEKQWPYKWVNERLYPIKRSVVKGKLKSIDGRSVSEAMVILAKEGGEFHRQKGDYIFYKNANKDGEFEITNVRPGKYTLYAYATHGTITKQLEEISIEVIDEELDLGVVKWEAPKYINQLWQIGQSTRKSEEFKFGKELRNYKWMTLLPKNLDYVIGKNIESEDWYYSQPKDGSWNIKFKLDKEFTQNAYLTVSLAGATTFKIGVIDKPNLIIKVNGTIVKDVKYENDTTVYRSAMRSGRYHLEEIEFDGRILKNGENIISFESISGAFMYDTILLETKEAGTVYTNKQTINNYSTSRYLDKGVAKQINELLDNINLKEKIEDKESLLKCIDNILEVNEINEDVKEVISSNLRSLKNIL